jgi:dihydrofolate synthase / folylpolyglutamate synthase
LLAELGDPHERLPPVIHVAGTNGKGSTIAFLRAFLEAAGYRVHVFSKPHLVRFNERIRLAGTLIDDAHLAALLEECERANEGRAITYFEITTAAAFLAFAGIPADILLLETGLGGRFDATNVIRRPAVTAITPVSLDHQHFLGETVAAIAGEKAGILKRGRPGVLAPQLPAASAVLGAAARGVDAPLFRGGIEWQVDAVAGGLRYEGQRWSRLDLPPPALMGAHQYVNAGVALACLDRLDGFSLAPEALAAGLRSVDWPARLQRLASGRLARRLPSGWELWLDGAHNQGAGEALARVIAESWRDRPLHLIFGMLESHDADAFLRPLAPYLTALHALTIPGEPHARSAADAAAAAERVGIPAASRTDLHDALTHLGAASPAGRVLVCGSLYLAGQAIRENGQTIGEQT